MINKRSVLGVITARGGSKGVPKKNVRKVAGKPLVAWTIEVAQRSRYIDRLVASTDDDLVSQVALSFGCEVPYRRSPELAADNTSSIDVVLDVLDRLPEYDYVVLLQPTSPLRRVEDMEGALELCEYSSGPACVSVCRVTESPYWMFTMMQGCRLSPLMQNVPQRRQELPPVYALNGAVYVAKTSWF